MANLKGFGEDTTKDNQSKRRGHVDASNDLNAAAFNLDDMIVPNQNKKKRRELVSVYFYPEDMDKLKTLSVSYDSPVSKIIEDCMLKLTAEVEVDQEKVDKYNESKNNK